MDKLEEDGMLQVNACESGSGRSDDVQIIFFLRPSMCFVSNPAYIQTLKPEGADASPNKADAMAGRKPGTEPGERGRVQAAHFGPARERKRDSKPNPRGHTIRMMSFCLYAWPIF